MPPGGALFCSPLPGCFFVVVGFYFIAEINSWKDLRIVGCTAVLFILGLCRCLTLLRRGREVLGYRGSSLLLT